MGLFNKGKKGTVNWNNLGNSFLIKLSGKGFTAANDDAKEIHEVFPLPTGDIKIATSKMPEAVYDKSEKEIIEQQKMTLPLLLENYSNLP